MSPDEEKLIELLMGTFPNASGDRGYYACCVDELIANGARIPVFCKDCKWFMEYTEEYKQTVEKADGDCYHRTLNSENSQFCGRCYGDYCSDGKRRDSDER